MVISLYGIWIVILILLGIAIWIIIKLLTPMPAVLRAGEPILMDHSKERVEKPLFSKKYLLTGKPDYIVRKNGNIIPIEIKSSLSPPDGQPYRSHIMQLLSYCVLIEECYNVKPKYGIIQYRDGKQIKILYTEDRKSELLDIMRKMRLGIRTPVCDSRCFVCGQRVRCDKVGR